MQMNEKNSMNVYNLGENLQVVINKHVAKKKMFLQFVWIILNSIDQFK